MEMKVNTLPISDVSFTRTKVNARNDLIAGAIAGSASIIVGHPLDTLKVQLQTTSCNNTYLSNGNNLSFGNMYKKNTLSSLFRGITAPLASIALVNSLKFYSFGVSTQLWNEMKVFNNNRSDDKLLQSFVSGSFSGFVKCFIICPMELVKCRIQYQSTPVSGPLPIITSIYKSHGIRGLYHGWWASIYREVPGCGIYFCTYDYLKEKIKAINNTSNDWVISSFAGGVSGCVTWAAVYPIDVIKTRFQTKELPQNGVWHVGKQLIHKHGWRSLYRGLNITLIRAFPVNAIIFPTYEYVLTYL